MTESTNNTQPNKMFYKLTSFSGKDTLTYLNKITNSFDEKHKLNDDFIKQLQITLDSTEDLFYGFLYAPKNQDITKQVIGKDGCYFHKTTEETHIYFIWHNRKSNKFEFWGQKREIIDAMNRIKYRIDKVTERTNQKQ